MMNLNAVHILTRRDERCRAEDGRPRSPRTAVPGPSPARLTSVSPLFVGPGPEQSPQEARTPLTPTLGEAKPRPLLPGRCRERPEAGGGAGAATLERAGSG